MKHHYNKEELIELKRKHDMQVSKEAIEEIKHSIDLDREIESLQQEIKELNDSAIWWTNRFNAVERDNRELKQEVERLNNIIKNGINEELRKELDEILKCNQKQAHRIDKAIEYIKNNCYIETTNEYMKYGDDLSPSHLIEILEGSDKE